MQQSRILMCLALAAAAAAFSLPATAQVQGAGSWLPYTGRGYLGLSVGRARYHVACGTTTLTCDNTETPAQIYLRSRIGNFWGVELGYLDMGRVNRAGTDARTQGLNLSVVGRAPLT